MTGVHKGRVLDAEWRKKISEAHKGNTASEETRRKMSASQMGRACWTTGKKLAPEHKEKIRVTMLNKKRDREWYISTIPETVRRELRRKSRIRTVDRMEANYGIVFPGYNKLACEYFKKYDIEHDTSGRYAVYGDGEYYIKELGYWPDYINFDKKLIMEWDEPFHYDSYGKLKKKDRIRQEEIQEQFPDFEFIRIKQ